MRWGRWRNNERHQEPQGFHDHRDHHRDHRADGRCARHGDDGRARDADDRPRAAVGAGVGLCVAPARADAGRGVRGRAAPQRQRYPVPRIDVGGAEQLDVYGRRESELSAQNREHLQDGTEQNSQGLIGDYDLMQHIPMSRGRRGFTMIELLVALVLLGIVSAALYRALRWLGFACNTPGLGGALGAVSVIVRGGAPGQPLFFGSRAPDNSKDGVLIYYDGNQNSRLDDFWATATITASPNGQNCDDGTNGQRLLLNINLLGLGPNVAGAIPLGAPVRGWEAVTYQLYQPAGDTSSYVGFQPAGQTMQPLIGPVLAGNGLQFQYYDVNGNPTAVRAQVARIDITVRARTAAAVRAGGQAAAATMVDSVVTSAALRNNRRF